MRESEMDLTRHRYLDALTVPLLLANPDFARAGVCYPKDQGR
jgi:hypothetical protein